MSSIDALSRIQELQAQIEQLKQAAIEEVKQKLTEARQEVVRLERELEELTGKVAAPAATPDRKRTRRETITDEELEKRMLAVVSKQGQYGINATQIADGVNQNPVRVREYLKAKPAVLKRQGQGPGTKFFLP
jgi:hypothetical protein